MERAASSPDLRKFTSRDVDHEYVTKFLPYTGAPSNDRLMAMHPLSDVRRGCHLVDVSMKDVWKRRKAGNFVMQNSTSEQYVSEAAAPVAAEYNSFHTLCQVKSKHTRSNVAPADKFKPGKVSSSAIGWHAETPHGKGLVRHPTFGISESTVTQNYVNMKATNMEACLRLCK
eukprot:CAMPEP_0197649870 /NCGR_PEP_ID=MMETSP1338-20131121/30052_1 /TAXON_ID=43686 ORGANISM="Pelagodinium beii, Strain RCC1491" /NCGR_SAMPLE_ID=MMETSP1338 /ASSEMBLY_ACC=CAM_ASM_000754 /LENGTH=171 /DNA_ID=CAMNT_0043224157 /DNA_START=35 /DNA_END=550 /DNA_ORIENTATION=-